MPHAESSNFAHNLSRPQVYDQVLAEATALCAEQRNWVANLANTSSLLWHAYRSISLPVNWSGFYVLDPSRPGYLILGPFQGKVACQSIQIGKGVCGTAAAERTTQIVPNVDEFPGHIACDGNTKSEIVLPIWEGGRSGEGRVVGVLDIDCEVQDGFNKEDGDRLEQLCELLGNTCDWSF